ncbi:uncharacterized protein [Spinacia oleracea]|uniref:Ubiquitin-like protease family profile domain-containing protein n=1 Tax=Spinacia oleracea TaxID=3562 RepID=A0A9R0JJG9_SPIOL|nr:uncharacterized protein LOC110776370 [Spinacia oleracea]
MSAYIMLLYRNCQAKGKSNFEFLCPYSISLVVQSRKEEKIQENRVERSRYIVDALQENARKGSIFLAPYNAGRHWILCVIDPEADVVYYLDPLREENRPTGHDLRSVVDTALLIYQNQIGAAKKMKKNTTWSKIQCPRQTNNVDCGYYVLRFMREIVNHNQSQIPEKYFSDCLWPNYSTEQIDEVKIELAHHILYFAS